MKSSELLRKAIQIIEERGWCQKEYENNSGQVCMIGAIHIAYDADKMLFHTYDSALTAVYGVCWAHPISFNDAESTTKEQVIEVLNQAIANLESQKQ